MSRTIAFVDKQITGYQQLANASLDGVEVYLLSSELDGMLQIQNYLAERKDFDSIQILSHGSVGSLLLGSARITTNNLPDYNEVLSRIGKSLVPGGDILFCGCNVAQGDVGMAFINSLALSTSADVAASIDVTGTNALGGNWNLEASTGAIEAKPAFQPPSQQELVSVLLVDDFGDTTTTTGRVAIGGSAKGNIDLANDSDWFKVDLLAGKRYLFDLSGQDSGGGTFGSNGGTPLLTLYNPQGSPLDSSFGGGPGDDPRLAFTPIVGGTYFLEVRDLADIRTGTYTLKAALAPSADDFAANTTTTGRVAIGGSTKGNIDLANDSDWFKVDLLAGKRYVFDLSGQDSGGGTFGSNGGTPLLTLYNPQGSPLDSSFGGGPGDDPRLAFTPTVGGTYFLEVRDLADIRTGTYTLSTLLANIIDGDANANTFNGSSGPDLLQGRGGNDVLNGNQGDDILEGGGGNDRLNGGEGNDKLLGDIGDDALNGGSGTDWANYNTASSRVEVNLSLSTKQNTLGAGLDILNSIENLLGSAFDDKLIGSAGANSFNGGSGSDVLSGLGGVDRFVLDNSSSADTITDFLSGTDKLVISQSGIPIGNGDAIIDGVLTRGAPGGFSTSAELLIFTANIRGPITTSKAAATIGRATSAYAGGSQRLFAVDNGSSSSLFLFSSSGNDALVSAAELRLITHLQGTRALQMSDLLFQS